MPHDLSDVSRERVSFGEARLTRPSLTQPNLTGNPRVSLLMLATGIARDRFGRVAISQETDRAT
jgi:hypothetical protein